MTVKELLTKLLLTDITNAVKLYYEHQDQITFIDGDYYWFTVKGKYYNYQIGYNNHSSYTYNLLRVRPTDYMSRDKKGQTFLCTREYHISKLVDEETHMENRETIKAVVELLCEQNCED
jgi:hypothetical protein